MSFTSGYRERILVDRRTHPAGIGICTRLATPTRSSPEKQSHRAENQNRDPEPNTQTNAQFAGLGHSGTGRSCRRRRGGGCRCRGRGRDNARPMRKNLSLLAYPKIIPVLAALLIPGTAAILSFFLVADR